MISDERERWLKQVWRWWSVMRLNTADMARISLVPESSIERDLHLLLDERWKENLRWEAHAPPEPTPPSA